MTATDTPEPLPHLVRRAQSVALALTWVHAGPRPVRVVRDLADWWIDGVAAAELGAAIATEMRALLVRSRVTRELETDTVDWGLVATEARRLRAEPPVPGPMPGTVPRPVPGTEPVPESVPESVPEPAST